MRKVRSGYRYYSPELGRWVSKDPIEEDGGMNLHGFVRNQPVDGVDPYGRVPSYHIFDEGVLDTELENDADLGSDRRMVITFILFPKYHDCCSKIDFKQTYILKNLEGPETKSYAYEGGTIDGEPIPFTLVGVVHPDPPWSDYYLQGGGEPADAGYISAFASYMMDLPWDGDPWPDTGRWYETANGDWVRRKTRTSLKTCATCIEGTDKDTVYGCVKWKLDYADLEPGTSPNLTVTGFSED